METNRIFANMWRIIDKAKRENISLDSIELDHEGSDHHFQEEFLNSFKEKFKEAAEGKEDLENRRYYVAFFNDIDVRREYEVGSFDSLVSIISEISDMVLGDTSAYVVSCRDEHDEISFSFAGIRE